MCLREEFRRNGEWLFRWRSYLPLLPLALVMMVTLTTYRYPDGSHDLDMIWELVCFGISLAGLAVRIVTVGHAPEGTSGRNTTDQLAQSLNTTGLYSVVRHPLYFGNYLMWLGVAIFPRSGWLVLVLTLLYWLYYERIMFAEEEFLRDRFGAEYTGWSARTPAFIPRLSGWVSPMLPFCLRTVLKRELSSFFGLVATFTLLEAVSMYSVFGEWRIDPLWIAIFLAGLCSFSVLLLLKRKTRILHVAGR